MKNFTFKQYRRSPKEDNPDSAGDSKDKDSPAYLKRREQVRKAQRTHRERKEAYIKSLENEVLQLRTNESRILQETRHLYAEVGRLRNLLDENRISYSGSHGYAVPSQSTDFFQGPVSNVSILTNPHQNQQLHIHGSDSGASNAFYLSESEGSQPRGTPKPKRRLPFFQGKGGSESGSTSGSPSAQTNSPAEVANISASASSLSLKDMNQTNIGMEFVLSLEAPCIHHIQGESNDLSQPTGHALTASAPLLYQAPNPPVSTTRSSTPQSWPASNAGLERLLTLSSHVPVADDEITPVQAWNHIRSHPNYHNLDVPGLRRMTEDMAKHVKCYGFGAVIEMDFFQIQMEKLFGYSGFA